MTLKNKCLFCDNKKTKLLEEDNMNLYLCEHNLKEYLDLLTDNRRKTQLMRRMVVAENLLN